MNATPDQISNITLTNCKLIATFKYVEQNLIRLDYNNITLHLTKEEAIGQKAYMIAMGWKVSNRA
jgi:hypothetical protein